MPESKQPPEEQDNYRKVPAEISPEDDIVESKDDDDSLSRITYREGPIEPEELQRYEAIVPGFAKTYLEEVVEESRHRREIENKKLDLQKDEIELQREELKVEERFFKLNHQRSSWGLIAGVLITLTALGSATYLGLKGHEKTAVAVVASLAGVTGIIYGTAAYNKYQQKQLEAKKSDEEAKEFDE